MIGIVGAMKEEVASLTSHAQIEKKEKRAGLFFYVGKLSNRDIVVVQSGIGKVNAAVATQLLIDYYSVEKIIFTGLAGSGQNEIQIGDFVLASSLVQHDFDLTHFGREKGVIPATGQFFETDKQLNGVLTEVINQFGTEDASFGKLHFGVVASGDAFIAESPKVAQITAEFNALAVEMEGAALAQVCTMNQIPFAVLRTISDNADENATADFQSVLNRASISEYKILKEALSQLV